LAGLLEDSLPFSSPPRRFIVSTLTSRPILRSGAPVVVCKLIEQPMHGIPDTYAKSLLSVCITFHMPEKRLGTAVELYQRARSLKLSLDRLSQAGSSGAGLSWSARELVLERDECDHKGGTGGDGGVGGGVHCDRGMKGAPACCCRMRVRCIMARQKHPITSVFQNASLMMCVGLACCFCPTCASVKTEFAPPTKFGKSLVHLHVRESTLPYIWTCVCIILA